MDQEMDLYLFCEWLAHRRYHYADQYAGVVIEGVLHFLHVAGMLALEDKDVEKFEKYRDLRKRISHARDLARLLSDK